MSRPATALLLTLLALLGLAGLRVVVAHRAPTSLATACPTYTTTTVNLREAAEPVYAGTMTAGTPVYLRGTRAGPGLGDGWTRISTAPGRASDRLVWVRTSCLAPPPAPAP